MRVRPLTLLALVLPLVLAVLAAYVQWAAVGLPPAPPVLPVPPETATGPYGFPAWLRATHYVNLLFMVLQVRSGLQILMDHPRLYWNVHCTPGTEWARFTPITVPADRVWTAKDDSRYLSPWIGLPGYRHTVGMGRHWHFLFADYRLRVYGLVEAPAGLSLDDLRALGHQTQITLHHCIQGWSGIAAWGGVPLAELIRRVRPTPEARAVVFHSFGEGGEGGEFYDSLTMANALHPQTLLAYEMNFEPLSELHGAPIRLRVENQLGFKMVKWVRAVEFVAGVRSVGEGEGGYNEDHEYFGELANI
ncbi:MAG TPA: molybdopterin-dependent oxidoreductase [Gemmataceae bacterium]|nr:molybdopterin-dependent oxidoreductase [Gemmataceae bacterium]